MAGASRARITASVAITAASVMGAVPLVTPTSTGSYFAGVELTASFDPISPWIDVFMGSDGSPGALANAEYLVGKVVNAPAFPVLQQVGANQIGYMTGLLDGTQTVSDVARSIGGNFQAALQAPFAYDPSLLGALDGTASVTLLKGLFGDLLHFDVTTVGHREIFDTLRLLTVGDPLLRSVLDFTASPASGILYGAVGPILGPGLAFGHGVQSAVDNLSDPITALNDLVNIPAHMAGAALNGGESLDVVDLATALGLPNEIAIGEIQLPLLPKMSLVKGIFDALGLKTGGLLSPAGSLFNALDFAGRVNVLNIGSFSLAEGGYGLPGHGPGAAGTLIGLPETIAKALNPAWSGGNPLIDAIAGLFNTGPLNTFFPTSLLNGPPTLLGLSLLDSVEQSLVEVAALLSHDLASELAEVFGAQGVDVLGAGLLGNLAVSIPSLLLGLLGG
ncbi:outer membrane porin GjpA [Mycobacterium sp. 1274756.6]|uniref:outer membrane porin GjpA n=1 Tax=Mycobacterium sp. 1274756.6 TaxID=1834076 RepID=UPI0018D4ADA8|nr:outer membrane porin GjpA [Mycobacterium sp. 1274756.6]